MTIRISVTVAAVLVAGCGSGGGATESCDGGCWKPTAADQTFIASFCAALGPCCATLGLPLDASGCATALTRSGFSADPSLTSSCLAELGQISGTPNCTFDISNLSDPCVRAVYEPSGPRRVGQSCAFNADCEGSPGTVTTCLTAATSAGASALCASLKPGKIGDSPCLGYMSSDGIILDYNLDIGNVGPPATTGFVCQESMGLFCDPTSRACVSLGAAGSDCGATETVPCATVCSYQGVCEAVVGVGESCGTAACDDTSYCDTTSHCVAKLVDGASCLDSDQCSGSCNEPSGSPGTCSPISGGSGLALTSFCAGL
jgi:hypothetical protein